MYWVTLYSGLGIKRPGRTGQRHSQRKHRNSNRLSQKGPLGPLLVESGPEEWVSVPVDFLSHGNPASRKPRLRRGPQVPPLCPSLHPSDPSLLTRLLSEGFWVDQWSSAPRKGLFDTSLRGVSYRVYPYQPSPVNID